VVYRYRTPWSSACTFRLVATKGKRTSTITHAFLVTIYLLHHTGSHVHASWGSRSKRRIMAHVTLSANCSWEASLVGLGLLTLVLSGLLGWQVWYPPEQGYERALDALDATLAQQWGSLPKPVQASLTLTYGRRGWTSPGDHLGARQ